MDLALVSKADGEIVEDELDQLTRVAQADILVNIAFTRTTYGPRNMVEFRVTSIDAATSKQIGGETGRSSASGAPISALLEESVLGFIDNFTGSIQRHFEDLVANGREGSVIFKIANDCPLTFESEVNLNGDTGELNEVIDYWMNEHTVNGSFTQMARPAIVSLMSRYVFLSSVRVSLAVSQKPSTWMVSSSLSPSFYPSLDFPYLPHLSVSAKHT